MKRLWINHALIKPRLLMEWADETTLAIDVQIGGNGMSMLACAGVDIRVPRGMASTVARLVRRWTDAVFVPGSGGR